MGRAVIVMDLNLNVAKTLASASRIHAKAPVAVARALNRSMGSGKTLMTRLTAKDLGIEQSFVRDRLKVRPATPTSHASTQLMASPKPLPVYAFSPSPNQPPSRGKGRGVSWRSKGRRVREPRAFIATVGRQHTGVFIRTGASKKSKGAWSKNLPIKELFGASIWYVATKYAAEALARAQEQLVKNLQHELRFALSK